MHPFGEVRSETDLPVAGTITRMSGMRVAVRKATAADTAALAQFWWRWSDEEHAYGGTDRAAFAELFSAWVAEHRSTHVPFMAEVGGDPVGMAWLMLSDRVPSPGRRHRRTGDVQSVFVVPELRDRGVGAALLDAVLAEGRRLALEHVTVHSSERAVPFYQRAGFRDGQRWLQWKPG